MCTLHFFFKHISQWIIHSLSTEIEVDLIKWVQSNWISGCIFFFVTFQKFRAHFPIFEVRDVLHMFVVNHIYPILSW